MTGLTDRDLDEDRSKSWNRLKALLVDKADVSAFAGAVLDDERIQHLMHHVRRDLPYAHCRLIVEPEERQHAERIAEDLRGAMIAVRAARKEDEDRRHREAVETAAATRLRGLEGLTPAKRRDAIAKLSMGRDEADRAAFASLDEAERTAVLSWKRQRNAKRLQAASERKATREREVAERRLAEAKAIAAAKAVDEAASVADVAAGILPACRHAEVDVFDGRLSIDFEPAAGLHLGSPTLRSALNALFLKRASAVQPGSVRTIGDRIVGTWDAKCARRLGEALAALDRELDAFPSLPVLPRVVEEVLGISAATRREWTRSGRLRTTGEKSFRAYGRTIEYAVHDHAQIARLAAESGRRDTGTSPAAVRSPVETLSADVPVPRTGIVLRAEAVVRSATVGRAAFDRAVRRAADSLGQRISDLRAADPEKQGPEAEIAALLVAGVRVTAGDERELKLKLGSALDDVWSRGSAPAAFRRREHETKVAAAVRSGAGYGDYPSLFPLARSMERRLVFHSGPTNSGKTHAAMERAIEAETAEVLSPLRLLALEHYERLAQSRTAALSTGEEAIGPTDATHVARTVEGARFDRAVDIAVVDEVQMLADPSRGWAWTNAIVGVPAATVIMTGPPEALPLVKRLAAMTGEELSVTGFERRSPLIAASSFVRWGAIRKGDALIAFSRREVHALRSRLVSSGRSVAVIYGALGPEVRRSEAARFRNGTADVVVATDAIGMGLNLGPLERVLFTSLSKFDGHSMRRLDPSEIRQIAGRAGRHDGRGGIAAVLGPDLSPEAVQGALAGQARLLDGPFRVRPSPDVVSLSAGILDTRSLTKVLGHLSANLVVGHPDLVMADMKETMTLARAVDRLELPLETRFAYACAPVSTRSDEEMAAFVDLARSHAAGGAVRCRRPDVHVDLATLEAEARRCGTYLWLARRFPEAYADAKETQAALGKVNAVIEARLASTSGRGHKRRAKERKAQRRAARASGQAGSETLSEPASNGADVTA